MAREDGGGSAPLGGGFAEPEPAASTSPSTAWRALASLPADTRFLALCLALQSADPEAPPVGSTAAPGRERVRFSAHRTLGFPPDEIAALRREADDRLEIVLNLIGLHGPASPLPPSVTERIIFAEGGGALADFLDLFNHRLAGLLFKVWAHYRHQDRYAAGAADPISRAASALGGLTAGDDPDRTRLMPFVGLLGLYDRSAGVVAVVLSELLQVPCRIEEFVRREIAIPEPQRFRLGDPAGILGVNTLAGETTLDVTGAFRVRLGPLTADAFDALRPDGPRFARLQALIGLMLRDPLAWDHALDLAPGEARPMHFGACTLGWDAWLDPPSDRAATVVIAS
jgi:type VI secretion system protein ImpH